jgi:hypothetical protein
VYLTVDEFKGRPRRPGDNLTVDPAVPQPGSAPPGGPQQRSRAGGPRCCRFRVHSICRTSISRSPGRRGWLKAVWEFGGTASRFLSGALSPHFVVSRRWIGAPGFTPLPVSVRWGASLRPPATASRHSAR